DYDDAGNIRLAAEYSDWFRSAENCVRDRAVLDLASGGLQVTSPLPGSVYVVDPDIPSSRRIPLIVNGAEQPEWRSESLACRAERDGFFAVASEGEHRIIVSDPTTGRKAETRIRIRFL
ncbi:MAG TPA: hypothetical protein VJS88_08195, partial [Chthoniobacterales bacterium]|nr:hypothetical protein [Chthoniobacterales bacterium]